MAHIKDRGKDLKRRWQARYRDPDGHEKSRTFSRKVDAQRWLDQVTADLVTGRYGSECWSTDARGLRRPVAGCSDFRPVHPRDDGVRIRVHIEPTLSELELRNLRPSTIQAWVRGRQTEVAPSYVRLLLTNLSTILSAAVEDGLIGVNPATVSSVKSTRVDQRRVVPWTVESVQSVVEAHPSEFRAVPVLGAGCGLRQGEIFGLPIENVDFLRRVVHVRQQLRRIGREMVLAPPNGGREREVPLPDVVSVALAEHLRGHGTTETMLPWQEPEGEPRTTSLLFTNRDRGPLTPAYYTRDAWKPALEAAGVERNPENGMHALRHHYASVLLERGVSIGAVAEYLGHHDPGFTLRTYAHLMPESEDRARAAIDSAHTAAESSRNANGLLE